MRSLVNVRPGIRGVSTKVRVREYYGGRDAEGAGRWVGRGSGGLHWHCATDRGTQIRYSGFGGRLQWIWYCTFQSCRTRMAAEERTSCTDLTTPKVMVFEKVGKLKELRFEYGFFLTRVLGAPTRIIESHSKSTYTNHDGLDLTYLPHVDMSRFPGSPVWTAFSSLQRLPLQLNHTPVTLDLTRLLES